MAAVARVSGSVGLARLLLTSTMPAGTRFRISYGLSYVNLLRNRSRIMKIFGPHPPKDPPKPTESCYQIIQMLTILRADFRRQVLQFSQPTFRLRI